MNKKIEQRFSVTFSYPVHFTEGLFDPENRIFADLTESSVSPQKVLFVIDDGVSSHHPDLEQQIVSYVSALSERLTLVDEPLRMPGGESAKNDPDLVQQLLEKIEQSGLDRHSFVVVIGGGAVIDAAGYAAAIAHRGIRLIRVPTTVLAQNDAAIGVKNGVNTFGKKNFLGTFVPPFAVLNDFRFLTTLEDRDWKSGISEAVKVALIRDNSFFRFIEKNISLLGERDMVSMQQLIIRCAELHLEHIATSGDPFEAGSSRPLDFGHWSAHKLEQLTGYELRHGEAVAIGIALDSVYSQIDGRLSGAECERILELLKRAGFLLYLPELEHKIENPEDPGSILYGLQEFREHLGGDLTIMLLEGIGRGVEVHTADFETYRHAVARLREFESVTS